MNSLGFAEAGRERSPKSSSVMSLRFNPLQVLVHVGDDRRDLGLDENVAPRLKVFSDT